MTIRMSKPKENVKGKKERYEQYQEAWTRINEAIKKAFYLEAVTIQESIMNDRLISNLKGTNTKIIGLKSKKEITGNTIPMFGDLIYTAKLNYQSDRKLFEDIDAWRKERNKAIHRIVRIGVTDVEKFLQETKDCAVKGIELAKEITSWHKKELLKSKKKRNAP